MSSLREQIAARPPSGSGVLPGPLTATAVAVAVAAGLAALAARLGPVSATPAVAAWWLTLPAGRRGLLRGELRRVLLLAVAAAVTAAVPVALSVAGTVAGVLAGLAGAGLVAAATVGLLVLRQAGGRIGWVPQAAGAVAAVAVVVPALAGSVLVAAGAELQLSGELARWSLPGSGTALGLLAGVAAVAAVLVAAADRRLADLRAGSLRASGETVQYATASVFSLDTRELGRALASGQGRRPRRRHRWRWVRRPGHAVVAGDLAVLARAPWRWGQLAVGGALPVLAARTQGLATLPALVAVAVVLGWGTAATALGEPSRRASASPAGDRGLPLDAGAVVRARLVVPLAVLVPVCGTSALLVGQGAGSPLGWLALGAAAAPAWAGAVVRGGYRPDLDWSGPVLSSPMGGVPVGVSATLVRGPDVGVLGTAPVALALLLGAAPLPLVGVQLLWSCGLAAFAVGTARPRG